jgi:hypothetical protein
MNRYIVLTEGRSCGHKHRFLDRAMKCYDHYDRTKNVLMATIPEENRDFPVWIIDDMLLSHTRAEVAEHLTTYRADGVIL